MAAVVGTMDDLVKDYLLFRGFSSTLKTLETEIKSDKDKGLRVEKIMDVLYSYVSNYDITALKEFWAYLDTRYFARLEQVYISSVRKLEISLFRWYVINAVQNNRNDKVLEFFEKMTSETHAQPEWRDWFALPFTKNPEDVPVFSMYFTKQWQDTFLLSLHNFLSVIFQCMPLPSLLMFDTDLKRMKKLQVECEHYKKQVASMDGESFVTSANQDFIDSNKPKQMIQYNHLELVDDFYEQASEAHAVANETDDSAPKGMRKFLGKIGNPSSPTTKPRQVTVSNVISTTSTGRKTGLGTTVTPKERHTKSQSFSAKSTNVPLKKKSSADSAVAIPASIREDSVTKRQQDAKGETELKVAVTRSSESPTPDLTVDDDVATKPYILLSQDEYAEHRSSITHCRFSESGKHVASSDMDGVVKIWSLNPTPSTITTVMSKASLMCFDWASKTDRLLLLGNKAAQVKLYDIKEKRNLIDVPMDMSFPRITCLLSNPTGSMFACAACIKGTCYLVSSDKNARTGRLALWTLKSMEKLKDIPLGPSSSAVNCMRFNHNGQLLIVGTNNGNIRLYDVLNGTTIASWHAHNGDVYTIQFSNDETTCFSLGADGRFAQWSVHQDGALVQEWSFHQGIAGPFSVSNFTGQKSVVTARGQLFACDAERQCVLTCKGNSGAIYSLETPGGGELKPLIVLNGHKNPVVTVDWSSATDNRMCLTGSMDGKIMVTTLLK